MMPATVMVKYKINCNAKIDSIELRISPVNDASTTVISFIHQYISMTTLMMHGTGEHSQDQDLHRSMEFSHGHLLKLYQKYQTPRIGIGLLHLRSIASITRTVNVTMTSLRGGNE